MTQRFYVKTSFKVLHARLCILSWNSSSHLHMFLNSSLQTSYDNEKAVYNVNNYHCQLHGNHGKPDSTINELEYLWHVYHVKWVLAKTKLFFAKINIYTMHLLSNFTKLRITAFSCSWFLVPQTIALHKNQWFIKETFSNNSS